MRVFLFSHFSFSIADALVLVTYLNFLGMGQLLRMSMYFLFYPSFGVIFNVCLCNCRSVIVIESDAEDEEDDAEYTDDETDDEVYAQLHNIFL